MVTVATLVSLALPHRRGFAVIPSICQAHLQHTARFWPLSSSPLDSDPRLGVLLPHAVKGFRHLCWDRKRLWQKRNLLGWQSKIWSMGRQTGCSVLHNSVVAPKHSVPESQSTVLKKVLRKRRTQNARSTRFHPLALMGTFHTALRARSRAHKTCHRHSG